MRANEAGRGNASVQDQEGGGSASVHDREGSASVHDREGNAEGSVAPFAMHVGRLSEAGKPAWALLPRGSRRAGGLHEAEGPTGAGRPRRSRVGTLECASATPGPALGQLSAAQGFSLGAYQADDQPALGLDRNLAILIMTM